MNSAQSSHIPAEGEKPGLGDLPWLASFALRGLAELVRARIVFARLTARDIPIRNRRSREQEKAGNGPSEAQLARITYVLPRLSDRLPWRSDCLIQAVAGQNWIASLGAASEIRIGVEHPKDGDFGAHAWLVYREAVVTGGDISRYAVLLSEERGSETGDGDH